MALMLSKTYDALVAAGAPEDKARAAAEEVANLHNRLPRIEIMLAVFMVIQIPMTMAILTILLGSD